MPFKERRGGRHTGRWVAKIVHQGEQHWIGVYPTKTEARDAEDLERAKLRHVAGTPQTCDTFALAWVERYPRPKESTNRHNHERVRKFANEFEGVRLIDVDRPTARAWAIRNTGHLAAVRAMFSDALNDGLVPMNPFAGLRIPQSRGRKDIAVLAPDEFAELLAAAPRALEEYGTEFAALIQFAGNVGLRPAELIALTPGDIDGNYARIYRQRTKYGDMTTTKNDRDRVVVVPPEARNAIQPYVLRQGERLFLSITGKPLTQGTLFYAWEKVRNLAGRPGLDFYEVTRHYCATRLLAMGLSHSDVAIQLGHTDGGALVMEVYGHPDHDDARKRILAAHSEVAKSNVVRLRQVGGR